MSADKQIFYFCRKNIISGKNRFWLFILLSISLGSMIFGLAAQENDRVEDKAESEVPENFAVSYDLRGCGAGFDVVWQYFHSLNYQEGSTIFTNLSQLQAGYGVGRFSSRQAIPNLQRFGRQLGSGKQTFALLLWRERGQDRSYVFAVQRARDAYGKLYYPFTVYESFTFSWEAWSQIRNKQNSNIPCDKPKLFANLPALNIAHNE